MAILRRRVRCHYCHAQSQESVPRDLTMYRCPQCDAMNYFDERGNITDPPLEDITKAAQTSYQMRYSRSPSPYMQTVFDDFFCDTCQRNQTLLTNILAEYLPDEDDLRYEEFLESYDAYKRELEGRYPQVCPTCLPRVQDRIRKAGYAAKADHLRRIMDRSNEKRKSVPTTRQSWTLRAISLAKWVYIASVLTGILWHTGALMMAPYEGPLTHETFRWDACLNQAVSTRSVDQSCVLSPDVVKIVQGALLFDLLTLWWNPKLETKTNSLTGKMRGLKSLWSIRIAMLLSRSVSLYYWQSTTIDDATVPSFHHTHVFMLVALVLSFALTWKTIRIVNYTPSTVQHQLDESLPNALESSERARQGSYHPAHLRPSIFDGMAHAFTSDINDDDAALLPPSPTLTGSSYTTTFTEATTPYTNKSLRFDDDDMDWTPTQRRFASQSPSVIPSQWSQEPTAPQQLSQELHSLFRKPDPNPFRQKIPAAPKSRAQTNVDPWKPGIWDPPSKETTPNFFREERKRTSKSPDKGLQGLGVPRNVQREADLFASPKFKYDNYGTVKDTGLEETFNGLFSK